MRFFRIDEIKNHSGTYTKVELTGLRAIASLVCGLFVTVTWRRGYAWGQRRFGTRRFIEIEE